MDFDIITAKKMQENDMKNQKVELCTKKLKKK